MSYQVLARKWRPNNFKQVVGQEHVLQSLINALEQQRLHHAYLFSGTRGVGKTSIARLLAKALNCEQGVSATPCNVCSSCEEISKGNFVDLIEIDAASKTKVEDTREILDNVQYKPTRGRYKVYLIDEVHMLSRSSFNALLKTLEEPPEHVKFLFATTETQKLPVTILSRCLQFNLKALTPAAIKGQLKYILEQESIEADDSALAMLSDAAQGSMRDALSLTDQAISHGNGHLTQSNVQVMLGTLDPHYSIKLLTALLNGSAGDVFTISEEISQYAPDHDKLLKQMALDVHYASMAQIVKQTARLVEQPQQLLDLANETDAELLQLYYSILIQGRKELPWAADPQSGFDMVLIRLLAFKPNEKKNSLERSNDGEPSSTPERINSNAPVSQLATPQVTESDSHSHQVKDNTKQSPLSNIKQALSSTAVHKTQPDTASVVAHPTPQNVSQVHSTPAKPSKPIEAEKNIEHDSSGLSIENKVSDGVFDEQDDAVAVLDAQQQNLVDQAAAIKSQSLTSTTNQSSAGPTASEPVMPDTEFSEEEQLNMSMAMAHEDDSYDDMAHYHQGDAANSLSSNLPQTPITQPQVNQEPIGGIDQFLAARKSLKAKVQTKDDAAQKKPAAVKTQHEESPSLLPVEHAQTSIPSSNAEAEVPVLTQTSDNNGQVISDDVVGQYQKKPQSDAQLSTSTDVNNSSALVEDPALLLAPNTEDYWSNLIDSMALGGRIRQLGIHSSYQINDHQVTLTLAKAHRHLGVETAVQTMQKQLSLALNLPIELSIIVGDSGDKTPYTIAQELHHLRLEKASERIVSDDSINHLISAFDATLDEGSIKYRTIKAIN